MLQRSRFRSLPVLLTGAALVLGLAGCGSYSAEVPDNTVLHTDASAPAAATPGQAGDGAAGDGADIDGARVKRLITDCLARYGLGERPPLASPMAEEPERVAAQRLRDAYDATLTNCSAEAMATVGTTPEQTTPSESSPDPEASARPDAVPAG